MGMGSKQKTAENKRLKEEKERQIEMFRQKREKIQKERENKRKMSIKLKQIQLEFGGSETPNRKQSIAKKIKDIDELSVSSGDSGQIFVHNLMGFWT